MMRESRPRVLAALVLLAVFALGAFVGHKASSVLTHKRINSLFQGTPEEVESHVIMMALDHALKLDEAEHEKALAILEKHALEHTKLREQIEPALAQLRAEERKELRAILTPAQQTKLDSIAEKIDGRRKRLARVLDH